jgi:hypothetical protein
MWGSDGDEDIGVVFGLWMLQGSQRYNPEDHKRELLYWSRKAKRQINLYCGLSIPLKLQFVWILFKNSVRTSKWTPTLHHYKNQLVNAVYTENHTRPIKQNEVLLIGKSGSTYNCHSALKGCGSFWSFEFGWLREYPQIIITKDDL